MRGSLKSQKKRNRGEVQIEWTWQNIPLGHKRGQRRFQKKTHQWHRLATRSYVLDGVGLHSEGCFGTPFEPFLQAFETKRHISLPISKPYWS